MGYVGHLLTLAAVASLVACQASSGAFDVLSMNVAGLPEILNDNGESGDKTENTALIGTYMAQYGYDLIHVQEDFNYHATLYKYDNHPYRTATSGGVPFGSGLNTLSNDNWVSFARVKWDDCSNASESDCLTPKGFTFMRWRVAEGVYFDAYNLHADAGTESGDADARNSNLQQVADYIAKNSIGNAVLVFGDTNSRYTRATDTVPSFISQTGLTDAWVLHARNGSPPASGSAALVCPDGVPPNTSCEVVDKVFYRGSKALTLASSGFFYDTERFLSTNLTTLTDHNPVRVKFDWSASNQYRTSDLYGGPHGTWFNDLISLPASPKVSSITLRGASRLDAVSFTLSSGQALSHGGTGGTASTLALSSGTHIASATLCWGKKNDETRNFYALLKTSDGKSVTAGTSTNDCATVAAPTGWAIVGMRGQDGDEMDQLGWIFAPA